MAEEPHYLPLNCPQCERRRVEPNGICEKCHADIRWFGLAPLADASHRGQLEDALRKVRRYMQHMIGTWPETLTTVAIMRTIDDALEPPACTCPVPGTKDTVRASCPSHGEPA